MLDWIKDAKSHEEDPIFGFNPNAVTRSETVEINAPSKIVWDILTDLPRYNEWNPFCIRAVSSLKMGEPIEMTLINYATAGGPTVPNLEYICGFEPERLLSWEFPNLDFWPYPARRDQVEDLPLLFDRCLPWRQRYPCFSLCRTLDQAGL